MCHGDVPTNAWRRRMHGKYKLVGHNAVEVEDLLEWAKSMESDNRIVGKTEKDGVKVSTVFLGLDYNFGEGLPLLFESMVFGGQHDGETIRYATWEEAEMGHKQMCTAIL
jgi:hypothetical protein